MHDALPFETAFAAREREHAAAKARAFDATADQRDRFRRKHATYYNEIERIASFFIPPGSRVLEIGCSTGDLLAALEPSHGVGVDISGRAIEIASAKHPHLTFIQADAETLNLDDTLKDTFAAQGSFEPFDYVVMSDVTGHLGDIWSAFRAVREVMTPSSRLFVTYYNFVWEPILRAASALGLKTPVPEQNWLGRVDMENLFRLTGFDIVQAGEAGLVPARIPIVASLANRYLARAPGLRHLSLIQYMLVRPAWHRQAPPEELTCSVVVPCRNERGNVEDIFARVPELGRGTELIFVDGNSDDGTVAEIEARLPERANTVLIHQGDGVGKGDAVRKGFAAARGDVLFILDADLTVPPEDLPKFYAALAEGHGEFINGTRLVYPMEKEAMRFLNRLGNKFFSLAFTYILGRPIKDTLCGTKVLRRTHYERIAAGRDYFGEFDPFGDFDLLFGAAKAGLDIVEVPVSYRARTYGDTKISRFRHGLLLLRMTVLAFRKFKLTV